MNTVLGKTWYQMRMSCQFANVKLVRILLSQKFGKIYLCNDFGIMNGAHLVKSVPVAEEQLIDNPATDKTPSR